MTEQDRGDFTPIASKACLACGQEKALRKFPKVPGSAHRLSNVCIVCTKKAKARQRIEQDAVKEAQAYMAKVANGDFVIGNGENKASQSDLVEAMLERVGGLGGLANLMALQIHASAPGSRVRTQMLDMTIKLIARADEHSTKLASQELTDADLEEQIARRIGNMAATHKNLEYLAGKGVIINGEEELTRVAHYEAKGGASSS
jgi:hypothetical protein